MSALRELLSDEIEHGRMGCNLRIWMHESPVDPNHSDVLAAHGAPPGAVLHAALVDALHTLIVPGLRELGMATGPIEAWLDSFASTN